MKNDRREFRALRFSTVSVRTKSRKTGFSECAIFCTFILPLSTFASLSANVRRERERERVHALAFIEGFAVATGASECARARARVCGRALITRAVPRAAASAKLAASGVRAFTPARLLLAL